MNVIEELQSLDINEPGRWPPSFRVAAVILMFIAVAAAGTWWFVVKQDVPELEDLRQDEQDLRSTFELRQTRAANFDAYRVQLAEIESSFGTMLRQLPGKTEVPDLLVDISETALSAGLEQLSSQPRAELKQEFYAEKPYDYEFVGNYHELGEFVSGIAALPRIVTLHDMEIMPPANQENDELQLNVTVMTYRYLEEEEMVQ